MGVKCFQCKKECGEYTAILISADGDFVCSKECKVAYEKEKQHFFNVIIHDEARFLNWMAGG